MNYFTDMPDARLVTILASGPQPGRLGRSRMGGRNSVNTEPRLPIQPEDIKTTCAELRRQMTRRTA